MARRFRRRFLAIVDPRFQWKYSLLVSGLLSLVGGFLGLLLYRERTDNTRLLHLAADDPLLGEVVRGDNLFLALLVGGVLLLCGGVTFLGLVLTHRISGPLFVFQRYLADVAHGRLPMVRPSRRSDDLQHLSRAIEQTAAAARQRQQQRLQALETTLQRVHTTYEQGRSQDALELAIQALEAQRKSLVLSLSHDGESAA